MTTSFRQGHSTLQQKTANLVDDGSPTCHPTFTDAVYSLLRARVAREKRGTSSLRPAGPDSTAGRGAAHRLRHALDEDFPASRLCGGVSSQRPSGEREPWRASEKFSGNGTSLRSPPDPSG